MKRIFLLFLVITNFTAIAQDSTNHYIHIRNIIFEGNKITKNFVILRELPFAVGDSIKSNAIIETVEYGKQRILNSKLFTEVKYNIKNWEKDSIDIIYKLSELFYYTAHPYFELADRNFNVWWNQFRHDFARINIGADFHRRNFRGRNEDIGLEAQLGFNKHIYLYYTIPYFRGNTKHGMKIEAAYRTGKELQIATDSNLQMFKRYENTNPLTYARLEFTKIYRPAYAATHELKLGLHYLLASDSLLADVPNFLFTKKQFYPELAYRFYYELTNDRNYPENGWIVDLRASNNGLGISHGFNQSQAYAYVAKFTKLHYRFSHSLVTRARVSYGQTQPYFFNRAMGFTNDFLRGYEYYLMDGSHYAIVRNDIRYKIFDRNVHQDMVPLFKIIPLKLFAKSYADIGYAHMQQPMNNFLNNRILYGGGVGFDLIISYYIHMRIEYSINALGENDLFLHGRKE